MILIIICTIYERFPLDEPSCDSTQDNATSSEPQHAMA